MTTAKDYEAFLASKEIIAVSTGMPYAPELSAKLKEHQRLLVLWLLRIGRGAAFAATGLGKGWIILEWARCVAEFTGKPVLILAPLAVSQQFAREAAKLGIGITICSSGADVRAGINVTNYQKLHRFDDIEFGGVACDEASIMKHLDGHYRKMLIERFRATPFRMTATATPSPNDHTELGGQAEFLGVMKHHEMLSMFFRHDGSSTADWELRGHAREAFWRWCCSWGAFLTLPSDIGAPDDGYILPPLRYHEHTIPASQEDARRSGIAVAADCDGG